MQCPATPAAGAFTTLTGGTVRGGGATGVAGGSAEPARVATRREYADLHRRGAGEQHVELGGGGVGQVDDAIADERPAIVDAHHDLAAIAQVRDLGIAGNGQGLVRRRHGVHVVALAQRGGSRVESRAVPRGGAALDPAVARGHHVVALAEHFVEGWIAARAARLGAGHRIGNGEHVGRTLGTAEPEGMAARGCSGWRRARLQPPRAIHRKTASAWCVLDTIPRSVRQVTPFRWRGLYLSGRKSR